MTTRSSLAELLVDPGSSAPAIVSTSPLVVLSYKALAEQIERLSAQLTSAGLEPGDCLAIVLPNSLEFLVVFLALTHARLVAAPLNPADKPDELRFFIKDAEARAVVAEVANVSLSEAVAGLGLPIWQRALTRAVSCNCRTCRRDRSPASMLRTPTASRYSSIPAARRAGPNAYRLPTPTCSGHRAISPRIMR
jgi:acyl-CoA synthetase (AMP-forming)/AMP-acid ligase II